jgi:uncharacterized membrane protein YoaK (UPF0700 family)
MRDGAILAPARPKARVHNRSGSDVRAFIVRNLTKNREWLERSALALVLPFVAGSVNASGFFIVGAYTSHVTGSIARAGDEAAQGHLFTAVQALFLVLCFFAGAVLATALVARAGRQNRARYVTALLAEATMLLLVTLLGLTEPKGIPFLRELTTSLLCLAMGVQNSLVTKLSGAVVRTTHLTGVVTDLGIETVHVWDWLRHRSGGQGFWQRLHLALFTGEVPELKRMRLLGAIFFSFLTGAVIGPMLYLRQGFASMVVPVIVLLGLVYFDSVVGLRSAPSAHVPAGPHDPPKPPLPPQPPAVN